MGAAHNLLGFFELLLKIDRRSQDNVVLTTTVHDDRIELS